MLDDLKRIEKEAKEAVLEETRPEELERLRVRFLGRKGALTVLFGRLPSLSAAEKPQAGREANRVKNELTRLFDQHLSEVGSDQERAKSKVDVTMPSAFYRPGSVHIINQVIDQIVKIFLGLGFSVGEGPEIETEYHNFEALNIPPDHPSRDSFDTFYLEDGRLLRSQTSTVQIRIMEKHKPPLKIIAPGKVYRPDATDASHSFMFHQVEGLVVDKQASFADLKGVLFAFAKEFFGPKVKMRFRPHFFPFTEPSAEADVSCIMCEGKGCRVCSRKGWLEILGAGMVHPNVLTHVGIDPKKWIGFAFGMGVERMAMLKYGITDIRIFFENDLRFLKQF